MLAANTQLIEVVPADMFGMVNISIQAVISTSVLSLTPHQAG
ncbi:hypothetical protein SynPROS91_01598 [Synechococcus sp. PROS-9-1]|nr:hypothetical protein SynPROS91_01598 [Synechococcus sp. PROS-9-1]